MIKEPASRLLLLALEAAQREAALRVQAMIEASAEQEGRDPSTWSFAFDLKQWVKRETLNVVPD